uniref:Cyclin-dependent protein kinase inhibitor SMR2-like n=1 Tax=Nicotiana tabacum TaxID=4097 RepID=A0A1S4CL55_TOBAC|nr:PREDICTED: cyclin-dependent protein kinase inhibitor SMR2-like [Nicotiana tabacum]
MSTDLEFRLEIQLPKINVITATLSSQNSDDGKNSRDSEEEEEIKTPRSPQYLIPKILSCPPAPKKPKRVISCKRKLVDELQFFEVAAREEVDSFFRSVDHVKRRCLL